MRAYTDQPIARPDLLACLALEVEAHLMALFEITDAEPRHVQESKANPRSLAAKIGVPPRNARAQKQIVAGSAASPYAPASICCEFPGRQ